MSNVNAQSLPASKTITSAKNVRALYWLGDDLRLSDNAIFADIAQHAQQLMIVYCIDPQWFKGDQYQAQYLGQHRLKFLLESLHALDEALNQYGQQLHIVYAQAQRCLPHLINTHDITRVYRSHHSGADERAAWQAIQQQCATDIEFVSCTTQTLFDLPQLPFELDALPPSFSQFKKRIKDSHFDAAKEQISWLPPMVVLQSQDTLLQSWLSYPAWLPQTHMLSNVFCGGEAQGLLQLDSYFSSNLAHSYKIVRNELAGWEHSTKFSPWLANGCLSARQVVSALRQFESQHGANESSQWIEYELLWREYFHWYGHKFNNKLFCFSGISGNKPLTSFYAQRLQAWKSATTPYALVNALMTQLNQTGYMSNRGRQIVASCLIHELQCDWRYGAAYFQQQLIDYDVAINWGNWQYLAGVGADPRGGRRFNLAKQQQTYDPYGKFINAWLGRENLPQSGSEYDVELDYVDMADWPTT
ncbi:cryptochrome DASH [Shewanella algicola]|uniref:Cryptochrome DASH n=1 Tax=Shewanella algicola TaxID=640633 RepID=A0A9X1ZFX0_9GAMM|nr:DASH family cryptochrome [Shewanella algicola]MCL1106213.1 DASH family cryptochrome [Shewanella algicola]GGP65025.1 cryptochrome DASH [Shewanella algicola]